MVDCATHKLQLAVMPWHVGLGPGQMTCGAAPGNKPSQGRQRGSAIG